MPTAIDGRSQTETRISGEITSLINLEGRSQTETRASWEFVDVTGVSVFPTAATIEEDQALIVTATVTPANAFNKDVTWTSSDPAVATVSDGIVRALVAGTTNIRATSVDNPAEWAECALTVKEYAALSYTALTILEKDMVTSVLTIENTEIVELTIERELGGSHGINFQLPHNSGAVVEITPGRYIECEGQLYSLESIKQARGSDGVPLLEIRGTHIFFEVENLQARISVARTGTILDFLQELLTPHGIAVSGAYPEDSSYDIVRYVRYDERDNVLDCIKKIFQPYFATYLLDNLRIIVIPWGNMGAAGEGVTFEYSVNNQAITKEADYSNIVTKLTAWGGRPKGEEDPIFSIYEAPVEIRNLYRLKREREMSFSGITVQDDLNYLTQMYMAFRQRPHIVYNLSVAELHRISNIDDIYPGRNFDIQLGKRVTVKDAELGIDVESEIQRYSYRPLEPWEVSQVVIGSSKPYDVTFTEPEEEEDELADASVELFDDIYVELGTAFDDIDLPKNAKVTLPDGTLKEYPVEWVGAYDGNTVGTYPLDGLLELPEDMNNPDNLKASINVIVTEEDFCIDLRGIISTDDPDDEVGNEDCLWFKY